MLFQIVGGVGIILLGLSLMGFHLVLDQVTGTALVVGGIGLLANI